MNKLQFCGFNIYSINVDNNIVNSSKILSEFYLQKNKHIYSHYINNRWENIYLTPVLIPSVLPLLTFATSFAKKTFKQKLIIPHELYGFEKNEFWFNIAKPGESTELHNHKAKSSISGVFYLKVPENSGNIIFTSGKKHKLEIQAKPANIILFPSLLNHYVPKNHSYLDRISLSFNCFRFPLEKSQMVYGYEKSKYFS